MVRLGSADPATPAGTAAVRGTAAAGTKMIVLTESMAATGIGGGGGGGGGCDGDGGKVGCLSGGGGSGGDDSGGG